MIDRDSRAPQSPIPHGADDQLAAGDTIVTSTPPRATRRSCFRLERGKDSSRVGVESAAVHTGRIVVIVAGAVRDVTRELGDFDSDVFEMREAARRAEEDEAQRDSVRR